MAADSVVDDKQVRKAVLALQLFNKSKASPDPLDLSSTDQVSLLFTLWKIPKKEQSIRIPLPHNQRTETDEVCLFTRDEPNMTPEQTQRFYKRILQEKGVRSVTEVIPYNLLKTEYKPFEAKRRLLGNFDLFLADDRIRRLLPSHLGKHFYQNKKDPISVDLTTKHLGRHLNNLIQGTRIKINNKGSCCMVNIGHSAMTTEEITENIEAAVKTVTEKMSTNGPAFKAIHLKSLASVALPVYTAELAELAVVEAAQRHTQKKAEKVTDEDDEDIPQLVPIENPPKKAKLEKPQKKRKVQLERAPKPSGQKNSPRARRQSSKAAGQKTLRPTMQNKSAKPAGQRKAKKQQSQKPDKTSPKPRRKARQAT